MRKAPGIAVMDDDFELWKGAAVGGRCTNSSQQGIFAFIDSSGPRRTA
jgi:hypothetical protein